MSWESASFEMMEELEGRFLLSGAPWVLNGHGRLLIRGSEHGGRIDIALTKRHHVKTYIVKVGKKVGQFPASKVKKIAVKGLSEHSHWHLHHRMHGRKCPITFETTDGDFLTYDSFDSAPAEEPELDESDWGPPGDIDLPPTTQPSDDQGNSDDIDQGIIDQDNWGEGDDPGDYGDW